MNRTPPVGLVVLLCLPLAMMGCVAPSESGPGGRQIPLTPGGTVSQSGPVSVGATQDPAEPSDLVKQMRLRDEQEALGRNGTTGELRGDGELQRRNDPSPEPPAPPPANDDAEAEGRSDSGSGAVEPDAPIYPVAGMVGQVNGLPIYTDDVLEPISEQLRALAEQHEPGEFRRQASGLIEGRVRQMVIDALIFTEAERDLTDKERQGLRESLRRKEAELIRQYGQGSRAVAERTLQEKEGKDLAQALRDYRQSSVVQRYIRKTIVPKVSVTRRELERAYEAQGERFNQDASRTVRVIVTGEAEAAAVRSALDAGQPFAEVAAGEANRFRREEGGLWGKVAGESPFAVDAVNQAVMRLDAGEWAGPIDAGEGDAWFVKVDEVQRAQVVPLKEAQRELDRRLREQQFRELTMKYREEVTGRGSYTDIETMVQAVLAVAASRYEMGAV